MSATRGRVAPRRNVTARRTRRALLIGFVAALLAQPTNAGERDAARHAAADAPAQVRAVMAVGMTVDDAERSRRFFSDVLDFEEVSDVEVTGSAYDRLWGVPDARARVVRLRLGGEELELTEYRSPKGRPYPAGSRSNDRWFQHVAIVVSDIAAAYARVRPYAQAISSAPQVLPKSNRAAAGIAAFYFRDPDGHALELIHFPAGKGDPRWQERRGRLFLGIDHTAIGTRSTAASLGFYRGLLGLRVAGESHNVGREQAQLTAVPGADVRITGLRATPGAPGVELLEYVAPHDGRDPPADTRANDLVHWHVTVTVDDVARATAALRAAGYAVASDEVVTLPDTTLGFTRAVSVHDPDGHALQLVAR